MLNSSISLAAGLPSVKALAYSPLLTTRRPDNVIIAVADFDKSVGFYERHFGMPIIDGNFAIIRVDDGPRFLGITGVANGGQTEFPC